MSDVPINYWAVLAGAVSNMVIGFLWFGPLFGKQWMALMGFAPEKMEQLKAEARAKGMGKHYFGALVGALVMAYVLAHSIEFASFYMVVDGIKAGLSTGFWMWLGFIVPVTFSSVLWEGKSWKLWLFNNGYWLLSLLVMGAIIAGWK